MLPKSSRLTRLEINKLFTNSRRLSAPIFDILHHNQFPSKISLSVPKKIVPLSVGRNRLRRSFYSQLGGLPLPAGHTLFILKSLPSLQNLNSQLQKSLEMLESSRP